MRSHAVLTLVCAATFLVYLDTSITPVAIPAISEDLGAGPTMGQWLLDAYTLSFACLLLTAGVLGDLVGRRAVLIVGTVGFTVASLACAIAPDSGTLIGARAAQGVCAAAVVPLSLVTVAGLWSDPGARARAIGIWGGVAGISLALGPLLGGVLVDTAGWRAIFWVNLPIGVVAVAGLLWLLPGGGRSQGGRVDLVGQILFLTGFSAVTFALIEGGVRGWGSAPIVALIVTGVLALIAFGCWELRVSQPMLPPALLRIPAVSIACGVNFLGLFGLYAVLYLTTVHLHQDLGLSALETGLRFLALFGCLGLAAIVASSVVARLGTRVTMTTGLLCIAAGLAGLCLLEAGVGYAGYAWALVLLGIGVPLSSGVVAIQAMMSAIPPEAGGTASGAMNTFRQFGAVFGVALAGILSPVEGEVRSMHVTFLVAAAGALAAAGLTVVVLRPRPERTGRAGPGGPEETVAETSAPSLSGVITDCTRDPVPAAAVTLVDLHGHEVARCRTDAAGGYRLELVRTGPYRLVVSAEQLAPAVSDLVVGEWPVGHDVVLDRSG